MDETSIRVLLLDIEGTTTSVGFVYQTLFPYARANMKTFVERNYGSGLLAADVELLRREHAADRSDPTCPPWRGDTQSEEIHTVAAYTLWLMDRDRKSTALKSMQGKIWQEGYASGELKSHIYPDVLPAFQRWRQDGKEICIFSSGSVLAQKLLFAHTVEGDLTPMIRAYFDTTTGPKREPASYARIAGSLQLPAAAILFISDAAGELDAARDAGMATRLCERPGAPVSNAHDHELIHSFEEVSLAMQGSGSV